MSRISTMLSSAGRFFLPRDIALRKRRLELMIWAFLLSLAYYPGNFGFLAWFCLVRPIVLIGRLDGRVAFNAAFFFAFFFNLFSLYWIGMVTPPGMLGAVVLMSFYYTAVFSLFVHLRKIRPFYAYTLFPFLWVGMEYFRTLSEFAFPWSDLGYTQSYYLYILQIVSVISVHGLSLLIVTVNVLLAQLFRSTVSLEKKITSVLVSLAIVAGLTAYGWIEMPPYPVEGEVKISLLQGSVPLKTKWSEGSLQRNFDIYDSLTQVSVDSTTALVIWPETAAPCYLTHTLECRHEIARIVRNSNTHHLIGSLGAQRVGKDLQHYNSGYLYKPDGSLISRYDKAKLVPFSEHVPYQDMVPFMKKQFVKKYLTFIDQWGVQWWSDFYPGHSSPVGVFNDDIYYALLICFECAFPEYVRQAVLDGAEFLVGITNDTWFGESVGIYMHSRIFITRAVENRCWGARAANSGLTFIVDDYGRIRDQLDLNAVAALSGKIGRRKTESVFTRFGDIVGKVSLLITLSLSCILSILWIVRKFFSKAS